MYSVYLVDDEPLMLQNMIHALAWGENGFEIIGSNTNPNIALEEIKKKQPDLVFCDLKMPYMDGISLMKSCREADQKCEFIILSAYGEFEACRRFFLMDGFDYLLKPLQAPEAEITLERLSRKLGAKNHLIPTTTFLATNTKAFDELISYISLNYKQKHTLKSLSSQFNLAETYICNLFAKHYQSTLTTFLTNIRMQQATRLITTSTMALKEIAINCGYSDYFYFCRVFKSRYSESPTEFRKRNRL